MADLLIVDDEASARTTLALLLRRRGHRVLEAAGVAAAMKCLGEEVFDVVVTDLRMPDGDGLDVLRAVKAQAPDSEVILLTAFAGWESAKEAIRLGALDYFEKGQEPDELYHRIDKALAERALRRENENLRRQLRERHGIAGLVALSPAMHAVLDLVERAAPTDATLLIQGESGTGKELIARGVHHASARAARPFVAVNCGAVPEALLESELFGHMRGAFTGAVASKPGLFEEAHGGTLFLDEIGDMPAALQVKLLRALQSGEMRRLGATQAMTIDVRVLAATNRDLAELIRQEKFREDLFYRLNVIQVVLPPLRERREDIPALAEHFLARSAGRLGRELRLSPEALERLLRYPWPGNVRELENAMERAAILARESTV
ncbi:MAG: sigma-54-dependent transcriptional regulator, partial [Candidatus Rokuibacteriota bacterium]